MSEQTSYFNTTKSAGAERRHYEAKAVNQEDEILDFFHNATEARYTPSEVLAQVFTRKPVPLTSVRRAMTNLTEQGKLVKCDKQRPGPFGRPEHLWELAGAPRQEVMF